MENIINIEKKLKQLEELLVAKRFDLQYWNKRTEQVKGTINVEPIKENKEECELEIECVARHIKDLKDLILMGNEHDNGKI